jgi:hypothetical protein
LSLNRDIERGDRFVGNEQRWFDCQGHASAADRR